MKKSTKIENKTIKNVTPKSGNGKMGYDLIELKTVQKKEL